MQYTIEQIKKMPVSSACGYSSYYDGYNHILKQYVDNASEKLAVLFCDRGKWYEETLFLNKTTNKYNLQGV